MRSQVITPLYESPCNIAELQKSDINVWWQWKYLLKGWSEKHVTFFIIAFFFFTLCYLCCDLFVDEMA